MKRSGQVIHTFEYSGSPFHIGQATIDSRAWYIGFATARGGDCGVAASGVMSYQDSLGGEYELEGSVSASSRTTLTLPVAVTLFGILGTQFDIPLAHNGGVDTDDGGGAPHSSSNSKEGEGTTEKPWKVKVTKYAEAGVNIVNDSAFFGWGPVVGWLNMECYFTGNFKDRLAD